MKRLLVLRHAKASQDSAHGDHGRDLAPRGKTDAQKIGRAMLRRGYLPDRVLCSTAKRAVETWEQAVPELKGAPAAEFSDMLYLTPARAIVNLLRRTDDAAQTLLVIGHNPGLEGALTALLRAPQNAEERARRAALAEKFPTGALAVLDCGIAHWQDLAPRVAALADFLVPRELKG